MLGGLVLLLLAGLAGVAGQDPDRTDASAIAMSNGGPWGDWAWPEMCPAGSYTGGGSVEVQGTPLLQGFNPPSLFPRRQSRPEG